MPRGTVRRSRPPADGLAQLLSETQAVVTRLLQENRVLKAQNKRLTDELQALSRGWAEVQRLARRAPR